MIRTAITLATRGMAVFPCVPRAKVPATKNGCLDATVDLTTVRQWWREEPAYNVAIATGKVSKVFVIDLDGTEAEGELRNLEAEHGDLPATVEVITAAWPSPLFQNAQRSGAQLRQQNCTWD